MIVRILTEDQYRIDDSHLSEVQRLDAALDGAEERGDAEGFATALQALAGFVREHGTPVAMDEVVASDLIVPAPDMTLEEAKSRLKSAEMKSAR